MNEPKDLQVQHPADVWATKRAFELAADRGLGKPGQVEWQEANGEAGKRWGVLWDLTNDPRSLERCVLKHLWGVPEKDREEVNRLLGLRRFVEAIERGRTVEEALGDLGWGEFDHWCAWICASRHFDREASVWSSKKIETYRRTVLVPAFN